MLTGTFAKKSQRQLRWSVMKPPSTGPSRDESPKVAPIMPWYLPRSRGLMMSPMMACESGCMVPMPRPWTARATIRNQKFGGRPQSTEPARKTTIPPM